jgi:hypothetical protein
MAGIARPLSAVLSMASLISLLECGNVVIETVR